MRPRPLGVTVLSALLFFNVATYVVLIVMSIRYPSQLRVLLEGMAPGGGAGPAPLLKLGAMLPVYFLGMAIVAGLMGRGLLQLKNWARLVLLALAALTIIATVVETVRGTSGMTASTLVLTLLRLGIVVLVAWYLNSAKVREAFGRPSDATPR
ncbi:MAG: hypothetical protein WBP79_16635 [Candidatus Acidiferrales bacterium]